jgi:hypothetical protein
MTLPTPFVLSLVSLHLLSLFSTTESAGAQMAI